jgi:hypothetical protein
VLLFSAGLLFQVHISSSSHLIGSKLRTSGPANACWTCSKNCHSAGECPLTYGKIGNALPANARMDSERHLRWTSEGFLGTHRANPGRLSETSNSRSSLTRCLYMGIRSGTQRLPFLSAGMSGWGLTRSLRGLFQVTDGNNFFQPPEGGIICYQHQVPTGTSALSPQTGGYIFIFNYKINITSTIGHVAGVVAARYAGQVAAGGTESADGYVPPGCGARPQLPVYQHQNMLLSYGLPSGISGFFA